jgi:hypothetical protein
MKYCYSCGRETGGEPLFCNFCARSYDVKLCPKFHVNPRFAEACSQCGSRELSIPHPKVPLSWQLSALLAYVLAGVFLTYISVPLVFGFLKNLFSHSEVHKSLILRGLALVTLWTLWVILPDLFRRIIRRSLNRRN